MKYIVSIASAVMLIACQERVIVEQGPELKPRLVVMTDIGPGEVEPDDMESAVRLLAYADRFEIEGICTTIGWNCDPYPEEWALYLDTVISAYEHDVQNLMSRSGQTGFKDVETENGKQELGYWPSADYIRSRAVMGSRRAGIGVIGEGNDSPGSELLMRLAAEDDDRPIWVASWGGSNTLAQAIWRFKQTATDEELKAFVRKFRIYTITDQDMQWSMRMNRAYSSHQWMRREFAEDLLFIWDESAWLNQCQLGKMGWEHYASKIQGRGQMGSVYPKYLWGVEGDTPSFLHLMPNGLNDPEDPTQVGWGGYHVWAISPDSITMAWTNYHEPIKGISNDYEHRFYQDEFNDFAARMAWACDGKGNRNPVVVVNGDESTKALVVEVDGSETVELDASATYDVDGDSLSFKWWIQPEAGTIMDAGIDGDEMKVAKVVFGSGACNGGTLHVVCEVHDNGAYELVGYKRVIIKLK